MTTTSIYHADDHWEQTLLFKSALFLANYPISKKSCEGFLLSGWGSMCQPYIQRVLEHSLFMMNKSYKKVPF